jgi:outer membrane protein TolC
LFERVFEHRADARLLREKISALRGPAAASGGTVWAAARPQSVSAGYGYVAGVPGGVSRTAENFLLGGNTGRVDLNFALSLRDTGEKAAQAALAEARAALLEAELDALAQDLRREAFGVSNAIRAADERVRIARQRLLLARNGIAMTAARVEGGLAEAQSQMATRQALHQAQAEVVRAECLRKANYLALLVLCGLQDAPAASRLQALR